MKLIAIAIIIAGLGAVASVQASDTKNAKPAAAAADAKGKTACAEQAKSSCPAQATSCCPSGKNQVTRKPKAGEKGATLLVRR